MIDVRRADARYVSSYDGIISRHCFSAGPHYDPGNTAFGPLIAVDEHSVAGGAGFAQHAHRGVVIVSWILDGVLRHEADRRVELIAPGETQIQWAGTGIVHAETNASADEPLRFVQMTLLSDDTEPRYERGSPPVRAGAGEFRLHTAGRMQTKGRVHLYVARGAFTVNGTDLAEGDSVRADQGLDLTGRGELLIWQL